MGDGRLAGWSTVVTGAAGGIGQAIAVRLAADGASVALVDRDDASATAQTIGAAGGTAQPFTADVTDPERVERLAAEVAEAFGPAQVLVNNVGIYPSVPFAKISHDLWRQTFTVNVESMFLMVKSFLPAMTERGCGRIINLTSNSIGLTFPGMTHYIASKMAVIGLTRGLASEVGAAGVTVNAIAPSIVRTPGTQQMPEELMQGLAAQQAVKRVQEPADLAGTVAFLASDDSAWITGQTLYVDGGLIRAA